MSGTRPHLLANQGTVWLFVLPAVKEHLTAKDSLNLLQVGHQLSREVLGYKRGESAAQEIIQCAGLSSQTVWLKKKSWEACGRALSPSHVVLARVT